MNIKPSNIYEYGPHREIRVEVYLSGNVKVVNTVTGCVETFPPLKRQVAFGVARMQADRYRVLSAQYFPGW